MCVVFDELHTNFTSSPRFNADAIWTISTSDDSLRLMLLRDTSPPLIVHVTLSPPRDIPGDAVTFICPEAGIVWRGMNSKTTGPPVTPKTYEPWRDMFLTSTELGSSIVYPFKFDRMVGFADV